MTRFENASPAARLALALAGLACLAALGSIGAVLIALAGLNRLSPDIDLTRVPAWLSPLIAGEASPRSTGVAGPARPKSQKRPASKRPPTGREKAINRSERGDHESRCDVKS
ncbi:MAG: hypothetical protein AB1448_02610 [Pseudomonadota bacterium]